MNWGAPLPPPPLAGTVGQRSHAAGSQLGERGGKPRPFALQTSPGEKSSEGGAGSPVSGGGNVVLPEPLRSLGFRGGCGCLVPHGVKQERIQCLKLLLGNLEPWQRGVERACPEIPETKAPACPGAAALPGVCCPELTVPVLVLRSSRRVPWTAWAWRCAGCEPSCR